jgi:hypothetical protein
LIQDDGARSVDAILAQLDSLENQEDRDALRDRVGWTVSEYLKQRKDAETRRTATTGPSRDNRGPSVRRRTTRRARRAVEPPFVGPPNGGGGSTDSPGTAGDDGRPFVLRLDITVVIERR